MLNTIKRSLYLLFFTPTLMFGQVESKADSITSIQVIAQEMSTTGETFVKPTAQLSWTVGEVIVADFMPTPLGSRPTLYTGIQYYFVSTRSLVQSSVVDDNMLNVTEEEARLQENNFSSVALYPNPAIGHIYVDVQTDENESFEIAFIDLSGRIVLSKKIAGTTKEQIDVTEFEPGVYVVKIYNETTANITYNKVIINK